MAGAMRSIRLGCYARGASLGAAPEPPTVLVRGDLCAARRVGFVQAALRPARRSRASLQLVQLIPVRRDPLLAGRRECDVGVRALSHERLLDPDQAGLLEFRQVAGEIALGEPGRAPVSY